MAIPLLRNECQHLVRDERNDSIAGKDTPKTAAAPLAGADTAGPSACDERKDGTNAVASAPRTRLKTRHPHHPRTVKRSRGTRRRRKRKLPTEVSSQKCSPARLRLILDCLAEIPVRISATYKAGIHRNALRDWLECSAKRRSDTGCGGAAAERCFTSTSNQRWRKVLIDSRTRLQTCLRPL